MIWAILGGAACFLICFWFDRHAPLRSSVLLGARLLPNVVLSLLAFVAVTFFVQPAIRVSLGWSSEKQFGLLHLLDLSPTISLVASFLWFDCSFYFWHRLNHMSPFFWRFHNVHHIDPELDITTSFRFHFIEIALSSLFRALQILIIGPTFVQYAVYEAAFQLETMFQHSNWRLPIEVERPLSKLLVTPRMHGIHHSEIREENRSNFSTVLSVWDRLFSTLRLNIPQSKVVIGVPAFAPGDNTVANAVKLPFEKQRDYWRRADGTEALQRNETIEGRRDRLAE
ncbi:MAG: sterol desaturase family protein [Bdellovibrionota bacterium]